MFAVLTMLFVSVVHSDPMRIQIKDSGKVVRATIPWEYRAPAVTDADKARGFVIVQRGWTLGGIAKAVYGTYDVSKLLGFNQIKDIDKISVGQKIWIRPKVVLTAEEKMAMARVAVWKRMKSCFYYRTRVKDYPITATREWAHEPLRMVTLSTSRIDMKQYFREVVRRTEWVDILEAYNTMVEVTETPEELLRLAGLMWQESSFKNVPGKHGEIGFGQILPSTGLEILKKNPDLLPEDFDVKFLTEEDAIAMLKDVSLNTRCTDRHLQGLERRMKDDNKALRRYNGHGPETIVYQKKVQDKIDRLINGWNKELSNLTQEKLKELENE
jgi:hypothetical protein